MHRDPARAHTLRGRGLGEGRPDRAARPDPGRRSEVRGHAHGTAREPRAACRRARRCRAAGRQARVRRRRAGRHQGVLHLPDPRRGCRRGGARARGLRAGRRAGALQGQPRRSRGARKRRPRVVGVLGRPGIHRAHGRGARALARAPVPRLTRRSSSRPAPAPSCRSSCTAAPGARAAARSSAARAASRSTCSASRSRARGRLLQSYWGKVPKSSRFALPSARPARACASGRPRSPGSPPHPKQTRIAG